MEGVPAERRPRLCRLPRKQSMSVSPGWRPEALVVGPGMQLVLFRKWRNRGPRWIYPQGRPFMASDRRLCHCPPMRSKCNEQTHGSNMWNGVASAWFSSCCLKSRVRNRTVRIGAGGPCLAPVAGVEIRHLGSRGVAASVTSPGTTLL